MVHFTERTLESIARITKFAGICPDGMARNHTYFSTTAEILVLTLRSYVFLSYTMYGRWLIIVRFDLRNGNLVAE